MRMGGFRRTLRITSGSQRSSFLKEERSTSCCLAPHAETVAEDSNTLTENSSQSCLEGDCQDFGVPPCYGYL